MHQYKIIARILLVFPIINFAFALPLETHQVRGDVVPRADVAIAMLAKRGGQIEEQGGLKGPLPEAPDQGSVDPPQVDTSKIQQVSSAGPELSKSPSEASLKHYYLDLEEPGSASLRHFVPTPPQPEPEKPQSKSVLKSLVSKLNRVKFWRRISGTGSTGIRDAVNTAQRDMQGLADTGTTIVRDIGRFLNVLPTPPTRGVRRSAAGKPS